VLLFLLGGWISKTLLSTFTTWGGITLARAEPVVRTVTTTLTSDGGITLLQLSNWQIIVFSLVWTTLAVVYRWWWEERISPRMSRLGQAIGHTVFKTVLMTSFSVVFTAKAFGAWPSWRYILGMGLGFAIIWVVDEAYRWRRSRAAGSNSHSLLTLIISFLVLTVPAFGLAATQAPAERTKTSLVASSSQEPETVLPETLNPAFDAPGPFARELEYLWAVRGQLDQEMLDAIATREVLGATDEMLDAITIKVGGDADAERALRDFLKTWVLDKMRIQAESERKPLQTVRYAAFDEVLDELGRRVHDFAYAHESLTLSVPSQSQLSDIAQWWHKQLERSGQLGQESRELRQAHQPTQ
jgi:hypothetical protein